MNVQNIEIRQNEPMKISTVLKRFAVIYPLLTIVVGACLSYFKLDLGLFVNIAILWLPIALLTEKFSKSNRRDFTPHEFRTAFIGFLFIDMAYQCLLGLMMVFGGALNLKALVLGGTLTMALHAFAIYLIMKVIRVNFAKRGILQSKSP